MGPSHSLCWQLCCKMPPPPPPPFPLSHTLPPKGEENDDDALLLVVDLWLGWGAQEKEEREDVFLPRNFLGVNRREGREREGRKEKAYESRRRGDLTSSLFTGNGCVSLLLGALPHQHGMPEREGGGEGV